jgi:hypothetical protein
MNMTERYDEASFQDEIKRNLLADASEVTSDTFPRLDNISAAFIYKFTPRPAVTEPAECVYVPRLPRKSFATRDDALRYELAVAEWNCLWEAAQLRHDVFGDRLPSQLRWLERHRGHNIHLIPFEKRGIRYEAYAPLYHLLPAKTLQRFGLPLIRRGLWPYWHHDHWIGTFLTPDFNERLEHAFANHIWPYLGNRSDLRSFARRDSIRLLAHNLDFWLPYVHQVAQEWREQFGCPVPIESEAQRDALHHLASELPVDVTARRPLIGGDVWCGVEESTEATRHLVDVADERGRLRAVLDAIRSNRVEDDFSPRWSYEREDFERRLYRKRSKVKVSFVEIDSTVPVHAPTSEVHEELLWQDLFAVVSERERHVLVCLRSGVTKLGDIAHELGYANHSPVSKALARIRRKASKLLHGAT